jgi:hypothetical protein
MINLTIQEALWQKTKAPELLSRWSVPSVALTLTSDRQGCRAIPLPKIAVTPQGAWNYPSFAPTATSTPFTKKLNRIGSP